MPRISYAICASPRTGSTLLSTLLWNTNVAGRPKEYFIPGLKDEILNCDSLHVKAESAYFPAVVQKTMTENGVFGFVLHAMQSPFFLTRIEQYRGQRPTTLKSAIDAEFPNLKYIFLSRKDGMAQAVSYYRAAMTAEWRRWGGANVPDSDASLRFSHFGIEKCRLQLEASEYYWQQYFQKYNLPYLRLWYEDLATDYESTVRRVFEYLGLDKNAPIPPPITKKIADARSREWAKQSEEMGRLYSTSDVENLAHWWAPL